LDACADSAQVLSFDDGENKAVPAISVPVKWEQVYDLLSKEFCLSPLISA
jgi:hypothetical protein